MNQKAKINQKDSKNEAETKNKPKTNFKKIKIITLLQQCKINEKYSKINMNSYNFYK